MSVEFAGATQIETITRSITGFLSDVTFGIRFKLSTATQPSAARCISLNGNRLSLLVNSTKIRLQANRVGNNSLHTLYDPTSTLVWYSVIVRAESSTTFSAWVDGTRITTGETYNAGTSLTGTISPVSMGGRGATGQVLDGWCSDLAVWSGQLSDNDCLAYTLGASPLLLNPSILEVHNSGLHDPYKDTLGGADFAPTVNSPSLNLSDNPKLIFPE